MNVVFIVILILSALFLLFWLLSSILYPDVNKGLRITGFLISAFTNYSSIKGLRRFANMANKLMPLIFRASSKTMSVERITIKGKNGNDIPLVIYKPKDLKPGATGFLWIHGGGFAIGTPGAEKDFLKPFVTEENTVAIVPDYTLSIDAPYPAAFDDCCSALIWMRDNADRLSINPLQILVGGASAGGGLAVSLSLYARDTKSVNIAFQFPIYPMINDKMDTSSMNGNTGLLWNERRNRAAWEQYLGTLYRTGDVPYYAAPLRADDFSGLPPAYTFVGTLDPFYDETLIYMKALEDAGVPSSYDIYQEAFHGFDVLPSKLSRKARGRLLEVYRHAVRNYYTDGQPQP